MPTIIATSPEDIFELEQKIERLEAKCDEYVNALLKGSQLIELFKQDEQLLKDKITRLESSLGAEFEECVKRGAFLDVFLDEQEAIWDRTKELASYEIAVHYLAAAQHRRNQGRSGDRISEIQNWIDSNGQPV